MRTTHGHEITSTNLPELDENEIYISHVGDGEYDFNVFGGAYTDQHILLRNIVNYLNSNKYPSGYLKEEFNLVDLSYWHYFSSWNNIVDKGRILICIQDINIRTQEKRMEEIAVITVEKINPPEYNPGN